MITTLTLDLPGRIVAVGGDWDNFAQTNDAYPACAAGAVLGRPLLDFVKGDSTRMWLEALLALARATGTRLERPYRCDSATEKRFMSMHVVPLEAGFSLEHHLLRTEAMRHPVPLAFGPGPAPGARRRCSCCNRIEDRGAWYEPDDLESPGRPRFPEPVAVFHGLCPMCAGRH